jgi:hypothetical protein
MAQYHRSPGENVVDIFLTVLVYKLTTLGPLDKEGISPDGSEGTDRAIDSPRKVDLGLFKEACGSFGVHFSFGIKSLKRNIPLRIVGVKKGWKRDMLCVLNC